MLLKCDKLAVMMNLSASESRSPISQMLVQTTGMLKLRCHVGQRPRVEREFPHPTSIMITLQVLQESLRLSTNALSLQIRVSNFRLGVHHFHWDTRPFARWHVPHPPCSPNHQITAPSDRWQVFLPMLLPLRGIIRLGRHPHGTC